MSTIHPTKEALIRAALSLLDEHGDGGFTVDEVLKRSGISKGSMYHHFTDFDDVVDHAHLRRFSEYVDEDIIAFSRAIHGCNDRAEFLGRIEVLARAIHGNDRRERRARRVVALARAATRKTMRDALAPEQARMTGALADVIREMQERGILRHDFSPEMFSTFVQAYSLGKVLDDFSDRPLDPAEWTSFVLSVIANLTESPEHQ